VSTVGPYSDSAHPPDGPNIILTGFVRGGTTLSCHLLNLVPDVVALHEPLQLGTFIGLERSEIMSGIGEFFRSARRSLIEHGTAPSKVEDGRVPDNPWSDARDPDGQRIQRVSKGEVRIDRPLGHRFRLAIKHPAMFTAVLPDLAEHWPCYAIVRNPLGVLLSWESIPQMNVFSGRMPMAENFSPSLRSNLDAIADPLERRLHLLDWALNQYRSVLPRHCVIRYEDIVATGGRALAVVEPAAAGLNEPLASKNANPIYNRDAVHRIAAALIGRGGWEPWYSRHDIETLAATLLGEESP